MSERYRHVYDLGWTRVGHGIDNNTGYPTITNITPAHVYDIQDRKARQEENSQTSLCNSDYKNQRGPVNSKRVAPIIPQRKYKDSFDNYSPNNNSPSKGRKGSNNVYASLTDEY